MLVQIKLFNKWHVVIPPTTSYRRRPVSSKKQFRKAGKPIVPLSPAKSPEDKCGDSSINWIPAYAGMTAPRTSILPVTAAEISALRRSCNSSMARLASAVRVSNLAVSMSRKAAMVSCSVIGGTIIGIFFTSPKLNWIFVSSHPHGFPPARLPVRLRFAQRFQSPCWLQRISH